MITQANVFSVPVENADIVEQWLRDANIVKWDWFIQRLVVRYVAAGTSSYRRKSTDEFVLNFMRDIDKEQPYLLIHIRDDADAVMFKLKFCGERSDGDVVL